MVHDAKRTSRRTLAMSSWPDEDRLPCSADVDGSWPPNFQPSLVSAGGSADRELRGRRRRRVPVPLVVAMCLVALGGTSCSEHHAATVAIPGTGGQGVALVVTHVVDGDTIDLRLPDGSTDRARLLGVDTPETVKPNTPVQCFGPEASARTKALLPPGTDVLLQRDTEARDRYGRLLVYVWRRRDGLFVNHALVADGFARTLFIEPNHAYRSDLSATSAAARRAGAGLWGSCARQPVAGGPGP